MVITNTVDNNLTTNRSVDLSFYLYMIGTYAHQP